MTGGLSQVFAFDLIGTLVDAKPVYAQAFKEACQEMGLTCPDCEAEIRDAIGNKRLSDIVANLFPQMTENDFLAFQAICNRIRDQKLCSDCEVFPGALEAVDYLKQAGQEIALVTGTSCSGMDTLKSRFHLAALFDERNIFYRNLGADARLSATALKASQLQAIQAQYPDYQVSMIGDSISDMEAAQESDFDFWGFVQNNAEKRIFQQSVPEDRLFSDFHEFRQKISAHLQLNAV